KERKRRRRLSETIRETIEREREKKNRTESDTSSQTGTGTTEDDMESISSSGMGSTTTTTNADQEEEEEEEEENEMSDDETISKLIPVPIPESLRDVIEKDFFFINEKNKLVNLPSRKSVLSILEDYVRFFALRYLARSREKRRSEPRERDKAFMTLDLCKEVVDGLRICFDFYVHTLLLYPRERQQAEKLKSAIPIKTEVFKYESEAPSTNPVPFKDPAENQDSKSGVKPTVKEKEEKKCDSTPQRMLRSKKPLNEEFALVELKDVPRGQPLQQQQQQPHPPPMQQQHPHPQSLSCESGRSTPTTLTSGTSLPEGTLDSNYSEGERFGIPQQFKELHNWTLLPLYNRVPPTPVLLYGPNHLLRLFVKMPEILYRMNVPSDRKKVILHHISLFLDYLSLHIQDLFPDSNYVDYIEN
ncbi:Male-specific lethal 3-like protein, partial [Armadillidium vulgare]